MKGCKTGLTILLITKILILMNLPLQYGDTGEGVLAVQKLLRELGYMPRLDGIFGRQTEVYVKQFQHSKKLSMDGIVGNATYNTMVYYSENVGEVKTDTFVSTMSAKQKEVLNTIVQEMQKKGIKNKFTQAAILAVVSKETNFMAVSETSYKNTSNARIRKIFQGYVKDLTDEQLDELKQDAEAFFNKVYGGRYGNSPTEGYKYRGRGLNGITFKSNYEFYNKFTTVDIVKYPSRLEDISVAVELLIAYFIEQFKTGAAVKVMAGQYNTTTINGPKTLDDAVGAVYHANAGWGMSMRSILTDSTGGRAKAFARAKEMLILADFLN